jgi:hypothetical protein
VTLGLCSEADLEKAIVLSASKRGPGMFPVQAQVDYADPDLSITEGDPDPDR